MVDGREDAEGRPLFFRNGLEETLPPGAVIGQQPFGGARMSGTNDKAGSYLNLLRWTSPRTIKENFAPPKKFAYPHMG
jgi:1-pyrroline-5-carboxylate dehydrogenase